MLWVGIVRRSILHTLQLAPLISGGKEDAGNGKLFLPPAIYCRYHAHALHLGT